MPFKGVETTLRILRLEKLEAPIIPYRDSISLLSYLSGEKVMAFSVSSRINFLQEREKEVEFLDRSRGEIRPGDWQK